MFKWNLIPKMLTAKMSLTVFWLKMILSKGGSGMWCESSEKCQVFDTISMGQKQT